MRLTQALSSLPPEEHPNTSFTLVFRPYQLYPDFPTNPTPKRAWYLEKKYSTEDKLTKYETLMAAYGAGSGIAFRFGGNMANTLPTHRVIQQVQRGGAGDDGAAAPQLVRALYRRFFEEEQDTTQADVLVAACVEAGVDEAEARRIVGDADVGLAEVRAALREEKADGVDSVPVVRIEGKRRDITLVGAKEVDEYVKALRQIIKESS